MTSRSEDIDDDFNDIYKEYTGPPRTITDNAQEKAKPNRSLAGSDEEDEPRDPNAVPTDFTSREAKVWEAKSKATERNWKKRKEEEMICKICGESGHFTQGCPSTLGANRKSQDFMERIPARESHVKVLFTGKVVHNIEKDSGCKIKIDEKFIIASGKDRLILSKAVDAVHKIIEDGKHRGPSSLRISRSRSPDRTSAGSRLGRSSSIRSHHSSQERFVQHDKGVEDRVREDILKMSKGSSQAYGKDRGRSRSSQSHSKSPPPRQAFKGNPSSYVSNDNRGRAMGAYPSDGGWDCEGRGPNPGIAVHASEKAEYSDFTRTLEELEVEYKKEAMELGRIRDKEEDEENYKHREAVRELRENYMKKVAILRGLHAKQREEFAVVDAQMHQNVLPRPQMPPIQGGYGGYPPYETAHYSIGGGDLNMDQRGKYGNPVDKFPGSRPHDNYGDRQRRDDYAKATAAYSNRL